MNQLIYIGKLNLKCHMIENCIMYPRFYTFCRYYIVGYGNKKPPCWLKPGNHDNIITFTCEDRDGTLTIPGRDTVFWNRRVWGITSISIL